MKKWKVADQISEIRLAMIQEGGTECNPHPHHIEVARRNRCGICGVECSAYAFRDASGSYHSWLACNVHELAAPIY